MFDSVRVRLTLWYAGVLALSLIAFALVIYYAAGNIFHERQDESLRSTAHFPVYASTSAPRQASYALSSTSSWTGAISASPLRSTPLSPPDQ